jgi:hypothetical protein
MALSRRRVEGRAARNDRAWPPAARSATDIAPIAHVCAHRRLSSTGIAASSTTRPRTPTLGSMQAMVHIDQRKWPDQLHWQLEARRLGDDEHGTWLHVPELTVARRGLEPPRRLEAGFVACVPRDAWWLIEYYWADPRHELYVNIGTPPAWDGTRVHQVDLDLDVVRNLDGTVAILDEDEFRENQVGLAYPPDLVEQARAAAMRAADMVRRRDEPFDTAARRWLAVVGRG